MDRKSGVSGLFSLLFKAWVATDNDGNMTIYGGGCFCGALRYEAEGEPLYAGHCYCADCRKASGSGFIPFMGFPGTALRFTGQTRIFRSKAASGASAVRNFCPVCSSLVFGGEVGKDTEFTIYAGSLDNPSSFHPTIAIFTRNRLIWAVMPTDFRYSKPDLHKQLSRPLLCRAFSLAVNATAT